MLRYPFISIANNDRLCTVTFHHFSSLVVLEVVEHHALASIETQKNGEKGKKKIEVVCCSRLSKSYQRVCSKDSSEKPNSSAYQSKKKKKQIKEKKLAIRLTVEAISFCVIYVSVQQLC